MKKFFSLILFILFLSSCKDKPIETVALPNDQAISDALIKVNQYMVKRNKQHIKNFIKRSGWEMTASENGIWIEFLEKNEGVNFKDHDQVYLQYKTTLINGELLDKNVNLKEQVVNLGATPIPAGLGYGIRLMVPGDSARIIIPPYLAYGNFGDSEKVPPDAILIIDLKVKRAK